MKLDGPAGGQRSRVLNAALVIAVIALGLLWRSKWLPLPPFMAKYGGDALWATMVFFILGTIFARASTRAVLLATVGCSFAVEFLQLYHAPWLEALRQHRLGRLALGSTFNWPDLVAYLIGAFLGAALELRFRAIHHPPKSPAP